jgi:predicted secreted protein
MPTTNPMTITWQDVATVSIVLLSAAYVARYAIRLIKRKGSPGCGCCTNCPADPPEKPLVRLDKRGDV